MQSVCSSIESLKKTEEFYLDQVSSGVSAIKTAEKINNTLLHIVFLEELVFRLNTLRRCEELSCDTFVVSPRQKNTKVLQKLETDPHFLHLIETYALTRKEILKRRAIIRRRMRNQRKSI
uniref:Uncharacterized protein n=1 Tax=Panagrolaimus sp. ES5 TaxID=591445 RepID=A0AC34FZV9_9BILA